MTPAQLDELQSIWPGDWTPAQADHIPDPYRLRLEPGADWHIRAFTIDAVHGPSHYIEAHSQDRDPLVARGRGKSFAEAKASLSADIAVSRTQLRQLRGMLP